MFSFFVFCVVFLKTSFDLFNLISFIKTKSQSNAVNWICPKQHYLRPAWQIHFDVSCGAFFNNLISQSTWIAFKTVDIWLNILLWQSWIYSKNILSLLSFFVFCISCRNMSCHCIMNCNFKIFFLWKYCYFCKLKKCGLYIMPLFFRWILHSTLITTRSSPFFTLFCPESSSVFLEEKAWWNWLQI